MAQILIEVSSGPGEGWTTRLKTPFLDKPASQFMSRLDCEGGGFPVVAADALPAALPSRMRELATATEPSVINDIRANIAARQPGTSDIATFGGYLHAVLFGSHWETIYQRAAGQPLDLVLRWPVSQWELTRLPWEMMHAPDPVSGNYAPITWHLPIARIVPSRYITPGQKARISPKVLFVVGADLHDVSIRPGAEFFSIWQRLQREGILFDFRVLQRASSQQIEDEIRSFQPSIVHFICHGNGDGPGGYLELVSTDASGKTVIDQRGASRLLDLLRSPAGTYPPVVVLNACYSGTQAGAEAARANAPLAAQLVEGGVPIVVGMGGQVSDLACRLFARRFYEALLTSQSVPDAVGEGRQAGIRHGSNPGDSVDWALPMLFYADGLAPEVDIDVTEVERVGKRAKLAERIRKEPNPVAFCGRLEVMEAQRALLDPREKLRVVVLEETDYQQNRFIPTKSDKFGKTRVLREMAARALMDGHLPCLLTFPEGDTPPTSAQELVRRLIQAILDAARLVSGSSRFDSELVKLYDAVSSPGDPGSSLSEAIRDEYQIWRHSADATLPARVIVPALQVDLQNLADLGKVELESPGLRVMVLADDLHKFDVAARTFLELIGMEGLGAAEQPVPVVFTFSSQRDQKGCDSSIDTLRRFVDENSQGRYVRYLQLERFRSSEQQPFGTLESVRRDPLALVYQQYLLQLNPGVVLHRRVSAENAKVFLGAVHKQILGIPSRLEINSENQALMTIINYLWTQQQDVPGTEPVIDQIDDERSLDEYRSGRR